MNKFDELLAALANASTDAEKAIIKEAYDDFRKTLTQEQFWQLVEKKNAEIGEQLKAIKAQDSKLMRSE